MNCPYCGHSVTRVSNSRALNEGEAVERRRRCAECGQRFKTREHIVRPPLMVVKRDGARQEFSRQKVVRGLQRACEKRPIGAEALDRIVRAVERKVFLAGGALSVVEIGRVILEKLRELDEVASIRFASVFEDFKSCQDFRLHSDEIAQGRQKGPDGEDAPADSAA